MIQEIKQNGSVTMHSTIGTDARITAFFKVQPWATEEEVEYVMLKYLKFTGIKRNLDVSRELCDRLRRIKLSLTRAITPIILRLSRNDLRLCTGHLPIDESSTYFTYYNFNQPPEEHEVRFFTPKLSVNVDYLHTEKDTHAIT